MAGGRVAYLDSPRPMQRDASSSDQPEGVPPLELTGERTLPDVPAENYWFRRHLAVYEWIAERCAGLDVVDMACGEGYGTDVLARRARARDRRRRQPRGPRARAAASTRRPGVRFVRDLVETLRRALRRGRLPPDDRARPGARGACSPLQGDAAPADGLRLDARTCSRSRRPGAEQVGQPLAPARVPRGGVPRRSARASSTRVELFGLFHARKLRGARAGAARRLGPRARGARHHASPSTTASPRPSRRATSRSAPGPLERALDFVAVLR